MAEVGSAYVTILPSAQGFGRKLSSEINGPSTRAGSEAGRRAGQAFHSGISRPLASVAGALAGVFAVRAVSGFLSGAIAEATEAAKVGAQTAAVLKSTRGEAGLTADQIGKLATQLSNLAGVDDEVIQQGENVLLTFTNVRNAAGKGNDVFNQATGLALDMSKALGTDLQGSVIQLGKALNDPIKGVTALQRVGVSFTEQQKKQIKARVTSGKTLKAQKIVLAEVRKEFGGTAAAVATPAEKMQVAWGNLKEQIGTALLPTMNRFATWMTSTGLPAVSAFLDALGGDEATKLTGGLKTAHDAGATLRDVLKDVGGAAKTAWEDVRPLLSFIGDHPKLFKQIAVDAGAFALALKAMNAGKGLAGALGTKGVLGAVGKGTPVPVFVTNSGFGLPGKGGKGATPVGVGGTATASEGRFGKIMASSLVANAVLLADIVLVPKAAKSLKTVFNLSFDMSVNDAANKFLKDLEDPLIGKVLQKHATAVMQGVGTAAASGDTSLLRKALTDAYADVKAHSSAATTKTVKDLVKNYATGGKQSGREFVNNVEGMLRGPLPAAKVPVKPDVTGLLTGGLPGVKVPVTLDTKDVKPKVGALASRIKRDLPSPTLTPKVQPKNALGKLKHLKDVLGDIGKQQPTPKLGANITDADRKLHTVGKLLAGIDKTRPTPKADLNDAAAKAKATWLQGQFVLLGHMKPAPRVNVGGNALGRLHQLQALLGTLDNTTVQPKVGVLISRINNDLPARAKGGPVYAGQAYMVGEVGPELFVPRSSGTIVPNSRLGAMPAAAAGSLVVQNLNVTSATGETAERSVPRALNNLAYRLQLR